MMLSPFTSPALATDQPLLSFAIWPFKTKPLVPTKDERFIDAEKGVVCWARAPTRRLAHQRNRKGENEYSLVSLGWLRQVGECRLFPTAFTFTSTEVSDWCGLIWLTSPAFIGCIPTRKLNIGLSSVVYGKRFCSC